MVATESQKPVCPVCHQADQVQTLKEAYESGIERFAPPPMPVARAPMARTMAIGVGVIALCSFLIIVLLVPTNLPAWGQIIQVVLTVIAILVVLALSLLAFLRVVQGDLQSQQLLPAWDRALANWGRLRYCKRDNVVFDPQQTPYKPLSDEELDSLLSVKPPVAHADEKSASIAQHAS
jgi:hypothetical protein